MLPPETIVRAAGRWVSLLRTSTLSQSWGLIRSDSTYADLTLTHYASALDWITTLGVLAPGPAGVGLAGIMSALPQAQAAQILFERALARASPPWLRDADILVPDAGELPQDAAALAHSLGLGDEEVLVCVKHVTGKIDTAERARLGAAGELRLLEILEAWWPGSTTHVAAADDGFGYDILFRPNGSEWHLEVKSTTRRGRLVVYLTRHEYEVSMCDPHWRLLVVGLDDTLQLRAVATARQGLLTTRAPRDSNGGARWQTASYELLPQDLHDGVTFPGPVPLESRLLLTRGADCNTSSQVTFGWMP
jgi:hypothetical protein